MRSFYNVGGGFVRENDPGRDIWLAGCPGCHTVHGIKMTMQIDEKLLERVIPAQDVLIAACALRAGVPVLTGDRHFDAIPGLMVIPFAAP